MRTSADNYQEWLDNRKNGIGASESACIVGCNPWKSNVELWEEKTCRKQTEDISDKPAVKYGKEAEQHIRELFKLDFKEYNVDYDEFGMIANRVNEPWLFATLDGELTETETGKKGILEIKTTEIMRSNQWEEWKDKIPQHYYIQVLHQLLATGYDFAILKAQIKWHKDGELQLSTRHYHIERSDVEEDLKMLLEKEIEFWNCIKKDIRPPQILPNI